jgi:hypothetical protein
VQFKKNSITLRRWLAFIAAGVVFLLLVFHIAYSSWFLLAGIAALFFGVTDFGRQCPLFMSVQHMLAQMRKKAENNSK